MAKKRDLDGVKLVVGDKNLGMCESVHEVFLGCKISALHGSFLPQHHVKRTEKQDSGSHNDAQGASRSRKQGSREKKGKGCH